MTSEAAYTMERVIYRLGSTYGFQELTAMFVPAPDLKVRWQRGSGFAELQIPDFLDDAPEEVLEEFIRGLLERMSGNAYTEGQTVCDWLTRPEFCSENQKTYLSRNENILGKAEGRHRNLNESLKRLREAGLVGDIPGLFISWMSGESDLKICRSTVLMKVAAVNDILDAEDTPDFVLDYCLYDAIAPLIAGYLPDGSGEIQKRKLMRKFKQSKEAEQWIKAEGLLL